MPRATSSQRVIPPKTLKKIDFTCGSAVITPERVDHAFGIAAAAEVAEVRRAPACERDHVERRHDEAGSVAEDPDLAVELHVRDALLARRPFLGRHRVEIAHLRDVGMPEERSVVDGELRVERLDLAVGRDDQRVDLREHRVGRHERLVELPDDREDLLLLARVLDPRAVDEAPSLPRLEALERVDVQAHELLRRGLCDLLDVDPAFLGEHEERLLRAAVERQREVVLLRDVGRALDPELAHDVAADVEPEDLLGLVARVVRVLGELDPAGLAAAAGEDLRLDDDLAADLLRGRARLVGRRRESPLRHGDPEALEELLALVLVEVHRRRTLPMRTL